MGVKNGLFAMIFIIKHILMLLSPVLQKHLCLVLVEEGVLHRNLYHQHETKKQNPNYLQPKNTVGWNIEQ